MNDALFDLIDIGLPAILLALTVLLRMVHRELGPFAGLGPGGKWMLTGAFGMGVLAFGFKIAVASVLVGAPEHTVSRLAELGAASGPAAGAANDVFNDRNAVQGHVWEALPARAPEPADNPANAAKVALGERLFNEPRLSADGRLSCASCHDLAGRAGGDGRATAVGIGGRVGRRNAPTVWNAAFQSVLFWDGRAGSLEEQAVGPILNPDEMGMPSAAEVERRLTADGGYRRAFVAAFGGAGETIRLELVAKAIAAYERTLVTADAPYDRFVRGDLSALTPAQQRGMALFETVGCIACHRGPAFSDASLVGGRSPFRAFPVTPTRFDGRYPLREDSGAAPPGSPGVWRVPSLRNVALTGPYLHNGSVKRLDEVVRIMASAQLAATVATSVREIPTSAWLPEERRFRHDERRVVDEAQIADIVAFLEALSGDALRRAQSSGRRPESGSAPGRG